MDKDDQDTIKRSLPELKKILELSPRFLGLLRDYRVFSDEMIRDILVSQNNLNLAMCQKLTLMLLLSQKDECPPMSLCMMLLTRGPAAYANFIKALMESGQNDILPLLERARSTLGQPAHHFIPPKSNNLHISSLDLGNSNGNNGNFYPPIYSTSPQSAEYRYTFIESSQETLSVTPQRLI